MNQSVFLRRDLWVFRELMSTYEERIETDFKVDTLLIYKRYLKKLCTYINFFEQNSQQLLRYEDALEFQKFFDTVLELSEEDLNTVYVLEAFKLGAKYFKIFLETMLGNLAHRSELQNNPLDKKEALDRLHQFLQEEE